MNIFPLLLTKRLSSLCKVYWFFTILILSFAFNSANAQMTIGGNASSLGSGCYRLTNNVNQKGYAYSTSVLHLTDTIKLKFTINLGSTNAAGADGIVFVLRDSLTSGLVGDIGKFLGFAGTVNPSGSSLGVEFDTYQNGNNSDPQQDHMALSKNWNVDHGDAANTLFGPIQALSNNVNIEDGNDHILDIEWNPTTQVFKVFLDCDLRINYQGDLINDVFNGVDSVHWGFVGATSGSYNIQKFCVGTPIENVTNLLPATVSVCKGDTVQLDAGDATVSYLWTPGLALNNNTIKDPIAFPTSSIQYKVREIYQCDTIHDSTFVNVIQPDFTVNGIETDVSCKNVCDGAVDLSVGGTATYSYQWSNSQTSQDLSGLCDAMYIVTVTNTQVSSPTYQCYKKDTFFITEPAFLVTDIINPTKTKCPKSNNCDGEARGTAVGGTQPYSFHWTSGENVQQASHLCAGWNFVTLTDAHACTSIDSVKILVPDTIFTHAVGDTQICIGNIAAIAATSSGGTPPFSYIWHAGSLTGPVISLSSNEAVSPPITTQYFVESYDANGCYGDTAEVLVKVRPRLEVEFDSPDTICPYDTVLITAIGVGGDSIYSFAWETGNFGSQIKVSPDLTRYYRVTISDFCGTPFYTDSIKMQVGGYDPILASVRVEDDSICRGKSIYMIVSGKLGFHGPSEYIYTWEHNQSHENIQFVQPTVTTTYPVMIEDLCLSEPGYDTVTIYVGDSIKPKMSFEPNVACKESDVKMTIDNYKDRNTYNWYIDTFDFLIDYEYDTLLYNFGAAGCFDFNLDITTDFGCHSFQNFPCAVKILESPKASFDQYPLNPSNVHPIVMFKDISNALGKNYWVIDGDTFYDETIVNYEFYEREEPFNVELFVTSENGCLDSSNHPLQYFDETIIYYPRSFTPNGDGLNDVFYVVSEGVMLDDFELLIYNRWGIQVFKSTRQSQGWDGRSPEGYILPSGSYFMTMTYRDRFKIEKVLQDEVIIFNSGTQNGN